MINIKDIVVLDEAIYDLECGKEFYDKNEYGVGNYFWCSLISDMESLIIYAGIHHKKFDFYRMFAKRFPYAIYYEINNKIAYIVAVLPMRKNPIWIIERLNARS